MEKQQTIRYLKLPFQFDTLRLEKDLETVKNGNWIQHYNTGGYTGDWSAIPLFAVGGDASNILAFSPDSKDVLETPVLKACLYFRVLMNDFKIAITSARLLRLGPGAEIKPHTDYELGYEDGYFRLHIPIVTNPDVTFLLDGDRLQMLPGECWYINANFEHSVKNAGTVDRVHLVIDGIRNAWTDEMFYSLAPKERYSHQEKEDSPETIQRIIEELQNSSEPAARHLITELKQKLARQSG